MKNEFIYHNKYMPISEASKNKIITLLESAMWNRTDEVVEAENAIAHALGRKYACLVTSGTEALYLAATELFQKTDSIAIPVYTCSAVPNALYKANRRYVKCDTDENGILKLPASGVNGLVAVSTFGKNFKNNSALPWIDDCTHAVNASNDAAFSILSIWGSKYWGGDIGGAILCDDDKAFSRIKEFQDYDGKADIHSIGRLSAISAIMILDRILKEKTLKTERDKIRNYYDNAFGINTKTQNYRYIIKVSNAGHYISKLQEYGIMANFPVKKWCDLSFFPNSKMLFESLVSLPFYPGLTNAEQDYIILKVREIMSDQQSGIKAF